METRAAPADRYDPLWNEGRAKGRRPRWANLAIGLSAAAHVGLVYVIYETKFVIPYREPPPEVVTDVVLAPRAKPPEPQPPKQPPPPKREQQPIPTLKPHVSPLSEASVAQPDGISITPPELPIPPLAQEIAKPTPRTIANPNWSSRPNAEDMARYYPERAQRLGRSGSVTLQCQVTAKGAVAGCAVLSEDPADFGFGDAAQKLSRLFKLKPGMVGDQAVEGAMVKIPIAFRIG